MTPGCALCGYSGEFRVDPAHSLREAWCPACTAKKRTSALAAAIAEAFGGTRQKPLSESMELLASLSIYEAQAHGALHELLARLPHYVCSEYLDGVPQGTAGPDGVRCENLEHLSFADNSFDLVITQDVLEHVGRPEQALREIDRVLKPGGRHIFTVPVHERRTTTARVTMNGAQRVEHSFPVYHGDPLRQEQGSLVHTDFGDDLVAYLAALSIPAQMVCVERFYAPEQIPWLYDEASRKRYLEAAASGNAGKFFLFNSIVVIASKAAAASNRAGIPEFSGERYLPTLDWPEVAFEHWHRYLYAAQLCTGRSVLDIACGEGYGSFALAQGASRVLGVDISAAAIEHARATYVRGNLAFQTGSCVRIPVEGQAIFDVVTSFETIEHLSSLEQKMFLGEVKRVLKPDGLFIVSTPNKLLYSDVTGYCNEHHVKEFYVGEFKETLGKFFPHVKLMGQKVYPVSYIWNEEGGRRGFTEHGIDYRDGQFRPGTGAKKLLYAIALCSNSEIGEQDASILLDLSERMAKFIKDLEAYGARLSEKLTLAESDQTALRARIEALEERLRRQAAEIERFSGAQSDSGAAPPWRGVQAAQQLGIKVINLQRRPDRLASFRSRMESVASPAFCERVERFDAIDGRSLSFTAEIRHTFRGNDFGYRRSFIGCAKSHLALWSELVTGDRPAFLILEDDVTLCRGFERKLIDLCDQLAQHKTAFDVVFLGYLDWHPNPQDEEDRAPLLRPFAGERFLGGTFAYLVSRRGARRLLSIAERDGIQNGIDRFVHRKEAELELFMVAPHLARAPLASSDPGTDSDIQRDFETPAAGPIGAAGESPER